MVRDYPDLLESEKAKIGEFHHILKAFFCPPRLFQHPTLEPSAAVQFYS